MAEKINKKDRITEIVRLLGYGYQIKQIAKMLNVSTSTIYRDYQNFRVNTDFVITDILYKIDKLNIKKGLESLCYSDICVLAKRFNCGFWIPRKAGKIKKLIPFLSMFFYFDLNPAICNKNDIKKAYFKKAKQLHPDMTKRDTNQEFIDMQVIYNTLKHTFEVM